jgi:hypothetical protein
MEILNTPHPELPRDQALTLAGADGAEKKSDSFSLDRPEPQSMSYRRSRNVALMKLAFLRPECEEEV